MSKPARIIDSVTEGPRLYSQTRSKSPQRSTSPNTSSHTHSSITKIQKDSSIHPISKVSSSALLKKKSLKRIKNQTPLIGKSPSATSISKNPKMISMLSKKPSLKSIENHLPGISSNPMSSYRSLTPNKVSDSDSLGSSLMQKRTVLSFALVFEKYEMYKGIFEEIISKDKNFAMILRKIKDVYEEFYEISLKEHMNKLKEKVEALNEQIVKKNEDMLALDKKVRKLSTENYELARSLDRSEEICNGIQNRLNKISKFDVQSLDRTEEHWKALVVENEAYAISFKNLEKKLRSLRDNEKKLKKLLIDIKKSGFPIEEFYEKTIKKKKSYEEPAIEDGSVTSDSGCLVSRRLPEVAKPDIIPELDLGKVEPDSWSSSESYSSYY